MGNDLIVFHLDDRSVACDLPRPLPSPRRKFRSSGWQSCFLSVWSWLKLVFCMAFLRHFMQIPAEYLKIWSVNYLSEVTVHWSSCHHRCILWSPQSVGKWDINCVICDKVVTQCPCNATLNRAVVAVSYSRRPFNCQSVRRLDDKLIAASTPSPYPNQSCF